MLKPITNWKQLAHSMRARGEAIYQCEDCDHVWIGSLAPKPERCLTVTALFSVPPPSENRL